DEVPNFYQLTHGEQSRYHLRQGRFTRLNLTKKMELLVLLLIGFLILVVVLPFVAMSKASAAKRGVDDLLARLLSVENDLRTLRQQSTGAAKPEAQGSVTPAPEGPRPETATLA